MTYGMQFERFYSLNDSVVGSFPHWHHLGFQQTLLNLGKPLCGGSGVSVLPYPHPQLFKVFKHLIYVLHRYMMQFERFYSLNDSVVGSFPHWHHLIRLGWQCRQMCLSATPLKRPTFCHVGHFFGCRRRVGETCCRHTFLHVHRISRVLVRGWCM